MSVFDCVYILSGTTGYVSGFFYFSCTHGLYLAHWASQSTICSQSLFKTHVKKKKKKKNSCPLSQWCHPTLSFFCALFPSSFNFPQHLILFQWVISLHQVAKVLEFQLQCQFLQCIQENWFPLGSTGCISLQSKGLFRVFTTTTVQKHQFFGTQLSL